MGSLTKIGSVFTGAVVGYVSGGPVGAVTGAAGGYGAAREREKVDNQERQSKEAYFAEIRRIVEERGTRVTRRGYETFDPVAKKWSVVQPTTKPLIQPKAGNPIVGAVSNDKADAPGSSVSLAGVSGITLFLLVGLGAWYFLGRSRRG
jgi:hypothetical protein